MKLRHLALTTGLIVLLSTLAVAQTGSFNPQDGDVDKVIVASTANFPDALISSAPATKLGIPVLLTDKDELSPEAAEAFEELDVDEAYIVGGPAVVSESVEEEISSDVNTTTRLWGMSQVGTSVEVSEYFWSEGSEKVIIVQYPQDEEKGYRLLAAIKNKMSDIEDEEAPILISQEGTLSSSVVSEVERLGASEAEVYSTEATNVTSDLEEVGVEEVEVEEAEVDELTDRLQETEGNVSKLVVVAAPGYREALSTSSVPGGRVHLVGERSEAGSAVEKVQATNPKEILAVGQPELAKFVAGSIENETGRDVRLVSGQPEEMASKMVNRSRKEWRQKQEESYGRWKEDARERGMKKAANKTISRAEEFVDENSSEEAQQALVDAQNAYQDENYFKARRLAVRALSMARSQNFRGMSQEETQQHIQQERGSMAEIAQEMSEINKEKAEELKNADSFEERRKIIEEFKQEQREAMKELRKEKFEERSDFRKKMKERFKSEMEMESKSSELEMKLKGAELELEAKYTAPTGGYSAEKDFSKEGTNINFAYTLQSPNGSATQALTEHEAKVKETLEEGTYSLNMEVVVDGETVNQVEEELEVPGFERRRSRHSSTSTSQTTRKETREELEEKKEKLRERFKNRTKEIREEENETEEEDSQNQTDEVYENAVSYTDSGFEPSTITIQQGESVTWIEESGSMWVASDEHPSHTNYDGTSRSEHCEDGESETFDQCSTGNEYEFTFDETGEFDYHNHVASSDGGTVVVE